MSNQIRYQILGRVLQIRRDGCPTAAAARLPTSPLAPCFSLAPRIVSYFCLASSLPRYLTRLYPSLPACVDTLTPFDPRSNTATTRLVRGTRRSHGTKADLYPTSTLIHPNSATDPDSHQKQIDRPAPASNMATPAADSSSQPAPAPPSAPTPTSSLEAELTCSVPTPPFLSSSHPKNNTTQLT